MSLTRIDLGYLTDQEQGMILSVLKRDTDLNNVEEQRIKQLHKTEKDRSRLKYLTGEWFYETKYKRHRDRIHGTDIIRTSMGLRKPVTISQLSQRWAENPSCVNTERKDVFIPPELSGLIEEPSTQPQNERRTLTGSPPHKVDKQQFPEAQQERQRPQIKPRQNPFNSVRSQRDTDRLINGVKEADKAPTEEPLATQSSTTHNATINSDNTETHQTTQCTEKPVPKKRMLLYSRKDPLQDTSKGDPSVKQVVTPAPRTISKQNGSSRKFTDSLRLDIPANTDDSSCDQSSATISPISLEMPFSTLLSPCLVPSDSGCLDRRPVHFSSIVQPIESVRGVDTMLDEDWSHLADKKKEQDRSDCIINDHHKLNAEPQSTQVSNFNTAAEVTGKAIQSQTNNVTEDEGHSISKVLDWLWRGSRDGTLTKLERSSIQKVKNQEEQKYDGTSDAKSEDLAPPVEQPKTKPSPKPRRGFFALFSKAETKDKSFKVLVSDEEVTSHEEENLTTECQTPCTFRPEADDDGSRDESKNILHVTSEAEDGNKTDSLVCEVHGETSPGSLSNLKSFWERRNRGPEILSIKKEDEIQESEPSPLDENYQNALDLSVGLSEPKPSDPNPVQTSEYPVNVEFISGEVSALSSKESNMISEYKISKKPIDIKTNANLVSSRSLLKQKDNTQGRELQEETFARDISDLKNEITTFKMSVNQQVSINELRSFWEKEKRRLKVIVGSPTHNIKDSSIQSCPQRSSIELCKSRPDIRSDSPDLVSSLDVVSLKTEKINKNEEKLSSSRVPEQDLQDVRGSIPYTTQHTFKPQSISDKHLKQSHASPIRSLSAEGQNVNQESPDIYQSKDQDQTRTPKPLRQFKVPPRDSYPKKESRKDGSPLRTFVIDINPAHRSPGAIKAKTGQTYEEKTLEEDIIVQPIMSKERKSSTDARLARSFIPLSLQHYLGLPEQTVLDERERLEVQAGETSKRMNQGEVSNESSPSLSHPDSEEITFDSSGSSTPEAWSFSHTSSDCNSDDLSPVRAALERANARPMSASRSLENLLSTSSVPAETPDTKASYSHPEEMKVMSTSVPGFIHQEMDYRNSDSVSVGSFYSDRLTPYNASCAFSVCSEVASMSSVAGSVISIYSSEFGNVEVKGTIQFAMHYLLKLGEFQIFVVQCKDLAVADPKRNRSDPYVKCYLLPDKAKYGKRKTCVRKKTLDPTYNEILRFKIAIETLKTQKLNLSVWHNDTFGHNSFLGEVEIDLAEWDFNNKQMNEYLLKGRQVEVSPSPKHFACGEEMRPEMRVALRFLQQTSHTHVNKLNGEVQIWVKECKNLPVSRGVSIDPFVKCTVLPESSRKKLQKTRVLKKVSNPEFNHTMVYDSFSPEDLTEVCVELTVWDHERLHNHFIGGIRLGPGTGKSYGADVDWMDSNSEEAALWEKMMQSQNEWVEGVLPLRMLLMAKMSR